jgi:DNA-binding transcriptional ArsR family regulator
MDVKSVNEPPAGQPRLTWDCGTAYDLFVSLHVLHHPEKFGLRGSWAAGVRSRLPAAERGMLQDADHLLHVPVHWIHTLPEPKSSASALWTLGRLPAAERLPALALSPDTPIPAVQIFWEVSGRGRWDEKDLEALNLAYQPKASPPRPKVLATMLDWWSRPAEFGEGYISALQAYQQAFFAEEEMRIAPLLQQALVKAQARGGDLSLPALLEHLSQGVRFTSLNGYPEWTLAPSYWSTPLVIYGQLGGGRMFLLFGARPAEVSLVPGEDVPDAMLRALKALADPTRLRILRYLSERPYSPAQLSRRLRLRPPTVIHHLNALRLAGLVQLTLAGEGERRYAARMGAVQATFEHLQGFVSAGSLPEIDPG